MGSISVFDPKDISRGRALLAARGTPDFTGVSLATSAQAIPIPILWGTRRVAGNIIWGTSPIIPNTSLPLQYQQRGYSVTDAANLGFGWNQIVGFVNAAITPGGFLGSLTIDHDILNPPVSFTTYGSSDPSDPNAHWYLPQVVGLCHGPINSLNRIWNGSGAGPVNFTVELAFAGGVIGGDYSKASNPPSLFYTVMLGSTTQNAWGYFAAYNAAPGGPYYPQQDLAYRGLAYVATAVADWGHGLVPPQQSYELTRTPVIASRQVDSYGIAFDYAPSEIIPDLLTNIAYGLGLVSADIDATTLSQYKSYVFAQGLYLSPLLDAQVKGTDFLDRVAVETNTWIYWGGTSLIFVPLGDEVVTGNGQTFTPDQSPAYNLTLADFLPPGMRVDRMDTVDAYSRLRLEFPDRFSNYAKNVIEWKDETLINQYGLRDASSISADDICDVAVAAKVVELQGKRVAYLRNRYTFSLASTRYIRILPGTLLTVSDPNLGVNGRAVRVVSVSEDDKGALSIVAEEYPGNLGISRPRPSQTWTPAGNSGGVAGTGGSAGSGTPVSTGGGTLTVTDPTVWVFFVAGDLITLQQILVQGRTYIFTHDQQRSPQPTPRFLESNPAYIQAPGGAAFTIENPQDRTTTPSTKVPFLTSGATYRFMFDGTILRAV